MKFRKIFTLFTLAPIAGYSTLLQVPEQYGTIQSAISASINQDTVMVSPGYYSREHQF